MATSLLVRWLQTKKFLLIELERLNHKTYYPFNIIYVYLGGKGGGVQFEQDFFIHSLKYNLSEIPIPYQIDLKEIATIVKPPLMTMHLFSQQWWPSYFFVDFFSWCCLSTCQKKHFIEPNMFYSPKMMSHKSVQSPPPYWPCLYNGHQSQFSILQIVGKFSN